MKVRMNALAGGSSLRLAKYIADSGLASRRRAEELIFAGKVEVNGVKVLQANVNVRPEMDEVKVDGQSIELVHKVYLLLNKPSGYLSSVGDARGRPTVVDLVKDVGMRLYPVGRLDLDTEGLLIMSNDGNFMNLMIHPRYHIPKTYQAWVEGCPGREELNRLRQGIELEDGLTAPAQAKLIQTQPDRALVELVIYEGRKRQVKRMFKAIDHPVLSLTRTAFGFLTLQGIATGKYRELDSAEIKQLTAMAQGS